MNPRPSARRTWQVGVTACLLVVFFARPAASQPPRRDDLVMNFGAEGVWTLIDGVFTKLHDVSPAQVAVGDVDGNGIDDIAINFADRGLWTFFNNTYWRFEGEGLRLLGVADADKDGYDEEIVETRYGMNALHAIGNPTQVDDRTGVRVFAASNVDHRSAYDIGFGIVRVPGENLIVSRDDGVWIQSQYDWISDINHGLWSQIHTQPAQAFATAAFDPCVGCGYFPKQGVVISFANSGGTWIFQDRLPWIFVHSISATQMAAADLDDNGIGDLVLDFGPGYGIWIYDNLTSWRLLHPSTSRHIVIADLDRNGVKDIVVDFGPGAGIWVFQNNLSWYQLTALSAEQIVVAHLK